MPRRTVNRLKYLNSIESQIPREFVTQPDPILKYNTLTIKLKKTRERTSPFVHKNDLSVLLQAAKVCINMMKLLQTGMVNNILLQS